MGNLKIDERGGSVETHHSAVVETNLLTEREVDPLEFGQPLLLDEPVVEAEQRLRASGVQPGVAAIDVDRDGRVLHLRETGRQQFAVHLLGRREQACDGELVLSPLIRRV